MTKKKVVVDFDPNFRYTKQRVKVTFGMWKYRATRITTIGGNCTGITVIDSAVESIAEELIESFDEKDDEVFMTMVDGRKELRCEPEDECVEDWLKNMVVKAEIISYEKEKK